MTNLSTGLLLKLLEILFERYKTTNVFLNDGSDREIFDGEGADLLRLIKDCVDELYCRIK